MTSKEVRLTYFAGVTLLVPAAILIIGFREQPLVRAAGLLFIGGSVFLIRRSRNARL
jgi:hypothetical protein